ncbi:unnamed protein product [Cyclocybe aegerita]|uniref:NACHT domain-containing protein n=1 Tax=Cyclocybe aegerita TaxID=1973307 RepID=A0A8S0XV90_CYCAE|nr:unnamed protein product [Cyclocybe aegerita]
MMDDDQAAKPPLVNVPNGQVMIAGGRFTQINGRESLLKTIHDAFKDHRAPNATHDSNDQANLQKCHPGTRTDILQKLERWVRDPNDLATTMWLFGPAGAGKTAIVRSLARILAEQKLLAASFFFSRTIETRSEDKLFVSTLAHQLAVNTPKLRAHVSKVVHDDPFVFEQSMETQFQRLIVEPVIKMRNPAVTSPLKRLIIIDGLDECLHRDAQSLIIKTIRDSTHLLRDHLKFLVVSRPEHQIQSTFDQPRDGNSTRYVDLLHDFNALNDIRIFMSDKFAEIKLKHPLGYTIGNAWPSADIIDLLVKKAAISNFIYARTTMDFIATTYDRPQDRLEVVLGLKTPESTEDPYKELDDLYRYILSSARTPISCILRVLAIPAVTAASGNVDMSEPLHFTPFLEKILGLRQGTVELWLIDLRSLISITKANEPNAQVSTLRFLHTIFSDFLLNSSRSREYFVDQNLAYLDVALGSLRILCDLEASFGQCHTDFEVFWECVFDTGKVFSWACELSPPSKQLEFAIMACDIWPTIGPILEACNDGAYWVWSVIRDFLICLKTSRALKNSQAYEYHVPMFYAWLKTWLDKYIAEDPILDAFTLITIAKTIGRCPIRAKILSSFSFDDFLPRIGPRSPLRTLVYYFSIELESRNTLHVQLIDLTVKFILDKNQSGRHNDHLRVGHRKLAHLAIRALSFICCQRSQATETIPMEHFSFIFVAIEVFSYLFPVRDKAQRLKNYEALKRAPDPSRYLSASPNAPKLQDLIVFLQNHRLHPLKSKGYPNLAHSVLRILLAQSCEEQYKDFLQYQVLMSDTEVSWFLGHSDLHELS